jgi:WD40 repeat protein
VIVSGGDDHTVRIWDPRTGQPMGNPLTGHTGPVGAVALGRVADRDVIVSGGDDHTVRIWDTRTGQPEGVPLTGHAGSGRSGCGSV